MRIQSNGFSTIFVDLLQICNEYRGFFESQVKKYRFWPDERKKPSAESPRTASSG
jgi:hypothetical protein